MTDNVFKDQENFMTACGQTVGEYNPNQMNLYMELIREEFEDELKPAFLENNKVEMLDGLIDILVVTVGALHSLGCDPQGAWNEVVRSNNSKVDSTTGKVIKREDGKILKPEGYFRPELAQFLKD